MMFNKILVPYDGSPYSNKALATAAGMAKENGSQLLVLNVVPVPGVTISSAADITKMEQKQTNATLEQAKERLAAEGVEANFKIAMGPVAKTILGISQEQNCDLIVMGNRGIGGLSELLLGGISSKVVQLSEIPVMVCKIPQK